MNEIDEIKDYWLKKYPNVLVSLWTNQDKNRYFGLMMSADKTIDLDAGTLGDLISQGEAFLRQVN